MVLAGTYFPNSLMDNSNSHDNSFELYSRRHSTRDIPASRDAPKDETNKRHSISTAVDARLTRQNTDENPNSNASSISIISGSRSTIHQTPSVKLKSNTKHRRSTANTVLTDKSDINSKTNRKGRNALTSSFLRRKRIEYAGIA